jgi:hypothetical protein
MRVKSLFVIFRLIVQSSRLGFFPTFGKPAHSIHDLAPLFPTPLGVCRSAEAPVPASTKKRARFDTHPGPPSTTDFHVADSIRH